MLKTIKFGHMNQNKANAQKQEVEVQANSLCSIDNSYILLARIWFQI